MELHTDIIKAEESSTFKIVIPGSVEKIIRHLCNRVHDVEWSGILFYTYEGSWETNDLNIICEDILPMDIGTSTYTDFKMSPEVISYMTEHDLLECECGLIHSHNNMAAFFSGTDLSTLKEEGNDRNHFVSLIVNNAGKYVAAITRKIKVHEAVITKSSYNTFNNEEVQLDYNRECERDYDKVEYLMLDVVKESVEDTFTELDERLDSIKKAKQNEKLAAEKQKTTNYRTPSLFDDYPFYEGGWNKGLNEQPKEFFTDKYYKSRLEMEIPEDVVRLAAARLLTCSMTLTGAHKFDFNAWISKMDALCDKAFESEQSYAYFIDLFSEYIMYETPPADLCAVYDALPEEVGEYLLIAVIDFLDKLPKCKYSKLLIEHLMEMDYGYNK